MAPTIFPEKNFARIFKDIHGYGTIFLDRIRERNWFGLVYDNEDVMLIIVPNWLPNSTHKLTQTPSITTITVSLYTLSPGILLLVLTHLR